MADLRPYPQQAFLLTGPFHLYIRTNEGQCDGGAETADYLPGGSRFDVFINRDDGIKIL
jgi:hypothetical protein